MSWVLLVGWETVLVSLATLATATVFERIGWSSGNATKVIAFVVVAAIIVGAGVLGFDAIMKLQTYLTVVLAVVTVGYIALTLDDVDWSAVSAVPSGSTAAFVGAVVFAMTGFGIGWVNAGADYSRYLPRSASSRGVVWLDDVRRERRPDRARALRPAGRRVGPGARRRRSPATRSVR